MDVEAITQASDNELLLLGLDKKGDILSLRNLKQKLSKESSSNEKRSKKCHCYMKFWKMVKWKNALNSKRWESFTKDAKGAAWMVALWWWKAEFISVRTAKGGGTREVGIKLNADKDDITGIANTIKGWWHLAWPISSTKTFHLGFTLQAM